MSDTHREGEAMNDRLDDVTKPQTLMVRFRVKRAAEVSIRIEVPPGSTEADVDALVDAAANGFDFDDADFDPFDDDLEWSGCNAVAVVPDAASSMQPEDGQWFAVPWEDRRWAFSGAVAWAEGTPRPRGDAPDARMPFEGVAQQLATMLEGKRRRVACHVMPEYVPMLDGARLASIGGEWASPIVVERDGATVALVMPVRFAPGDVGPVLVECEAGSVWTAPPQAPPPAVVLWRGGGR
ncbi:MAG: hypothetical protein ACI9K2_007190 [Myxococcota bacterium]|jgi:hypothetical protein